MYGGEAGLIVFCITPSSQSLASFIDSVLELIGLNSRSNWLNLLGLLPKVNSPRRRRIHLSPIMATVCSTSSLACFLLKGCSMGYSCVLGIYSSPTDT